MWKRLKVTNELMNSSLSPCQPGDFKSLRKETPYDIGHFSQRQEVSITV